MNTSVAITSSAHGWTSVKRIAVGLAVGVASLAASLGGSVGGSSPAHAQELPCIVNGRTTRVLGHHDIWVDARTQSTQVAVIQPGRAINVIYLSGTVWSGTWFTAPNGPQGWLNWPAPSSPYSNTVGGPESPWAAPGVNLYSMVGQVSPVDRRGFQWNQPFFHATAGSDRCVQARTAVIYSVTMNDQRFDDNTGGFWVRIEDLG